MTASPNIPEMDQEQLNDWLKRLELALGDLRVADRADIVMELNTHISESLERGDRGVDEILGALGDPANVANQYRLARGLPLSGSPAARPKNSRRRRFFKWLALSLLGLFALLVLAVILLVRSCFPIVQVNEEKGSVKILGGLIDVQDLDDSGFSVDEGEDSETVFGMGPVRSNISGKLIESGIETVAIKASNGRMTIQAGQSDSGLEYKCAAHGTQALSQQDILRRPGNGELLFDFSAQSGFSRCTFTIPEKSKVRIEMNNGLLSLDKLTQTTDASIVNGRIAFSRAPQTLYAVDAKVTNGQLSGMEKLDEQSQGAKNNAKPVDAKLRVTNGIIKIK